MDLLSAIGVSIIFAAAFALVARRLRQPLILGYVLGGAVLGPHMGLAVVTDEASIELISEIGLILLLFIIVRPGAIATEVLRRGTQSA